MGHFILSAILLYVWNEDKTDNTGSGLDLDDLYILVLTVDRLPLFTPPQYYQAEHGIPSLGLQVLSEIWATAILKSYLWNGCYEISTERLFILTRTHSMQNVRLRNDQSRQTIGGMTGEADKIEQI